jgi:hypothetical protein
MEKYKLAIFVLTTVISSYAGTQTPDSLWHFEHSIKSSTIMIKSTTNNVFESDAYINHYYVTDINNQVNPSDPTPKNWTVYKLSHLVYTGC